MKLFTVRSRKHLNPLTASGYAGRWNKEEQWVIYTAESRSLASLEWLISRGGRLLSNDFILITLEFQSISDKDIYEVASDHLPIDWRDLAAYSSLQQIGSVWYSERKECILSVPSALVPEERNYVLHVPRIGKDLDDCIVDVQPVNWLGRIQW
jgi:RES domain-containing protein